MTDVREVTRELLADNPDLADALETLLEIDADGPFEFDDVPLDSGQFGEVVAAGIAEQTGGGYRLADPDAVRAVVHGDEPAKTETDRFPQFDAGDISIDWTLVAAVGGVLVLAFLMRTVFTYGAVFREGNIVLLGNDAYFHRYWVEQLLATNGGISLGGLSSLPGGLAVHDVLAFVTMWTFATLLGGTPHAAGLALAWYPVLFGLIAVYLVYRIGTQLARDRRVGLAAAAMLAITPVHAYRTGLGFGDHHAVDMLLIAIGFWSVVALTRQRKLDDPRQWVAACALAAATTGLTLAWRGGPIFLVPFGVVATTWAFTTLHHGRSFRQLVPFCAGLALAAIASIAVHESLGWVEGYRAFAPGMLFGGVLCVLAVSLVASRLDLGVPVAAGGGAVALGAGAVLAWRVVPDVQRAVGQAQLYFSQTGSSSIAETRSLFSTDLGGIFAPALLFGFVFFLGIGYLAWATWYSTRAYRPGWTAAATFAWCYVLLAVAQNRFSGPLSLFVAVFAGLGFVHLASRLDVTERPAILTDAADQTLSLPDRDTVKFTVVLFLLVGSLSFVQTPVKSSQLTIDDGTYEAAMAANESAAERNLSYPDNFVLSQWSQNRVYNYFVSGESQSYGYARQTYRSFLSGSNASAWAGRLRDRPVGFVVTEDRDGFDPSAMQTRLHDHYGSQDGNISGLGHYRLVYASPDGSTKLFAVVNGTTVTAEATPGERVIVSTDVAVSGTEFEYRRVATANESGVARVTVPYAGMYRTGNGTVDVTESELST
ncbi:STT3 domain-containing protein [Haloarcula laminariae]|uniref:STT3 domain-containing protein n=1 Tax=Haloarcula laminariae TaxID=2961577 RepID=UPI00240748D1|nr:STT3 domain-containing protein [Halomicroarcula sp. FL173]